MNHQNPQAHLFYEHVANKDYDALSRLYAFQARNAILSFLAMRHRWNTNNNGSAPQQQNARFEEKMDDFWQELSTREAQVAAPSNVNGSSGSNSSSSGNGMSGMSSWLARSKSSQVEQDPSYYTLLRELATFLTEKEQDYNDNIVNNHNNSNSNINNNEGESPAKRTKLEISSDAERFLRDAAAAFSDSRPPATFVVYEDGSLESSSQQQHEQQQQDADDMIMMQMAMAENNQNQNLDQAMNHPAVAVAAGSHHHSSSQQQQQHHQGPPIFDGSVANATPPPLGGSAGVAGGASGGAGTILHLACALDEPLALAFCLAMGADARACHTAFRRLMIHEASCNGSIQCLTLLLELGRKYGSQGSTHENDADAKLPPRLTRTSGSSSGSNNSSTGFELPFMPRRLDRADVMAPLHYYARQPISAFVRKSVPSEKPMPDAPPSMSSSGSGGADFVSMLRMFRTLARRVKKGTISELDAARKVLDLANLSATAKQSLSRTCTFGAANQQQQPPPVLVPRGTIPTGSSSSDGHGNTPLHWAAFKNETECVRLLLAYGADPNARAHPSGWTPLHDAAYSNSMECVDLLIQAGANVDARANSGATPLCFAAQEDAAEAAALLLARHADLATRCAGGPVRGGGGNADGNNIAQRQQQPPAHHPHSRFSGYTPLHYCAHYNAHRAARILLTHPTAIAAMEIPDLNDRLPIHVAVARGSSDVLRELLHAGARVETRIISSSRLDSSSPISSMDASNNSVISSSTNNTMQSEQRRRQPPAPEHPTTPRGSGRSSPGGSATGSVTPVSSPILRSMIPSQPVTSSKPWNCLTQRSIDECRNLISQAEMNWSVERHALFTPHDRRGVVEVLKVGKRLEQNGAGIFIELWPTVLSFCGRGWFDPEAGANGPNENAIMTMAAATVAALANGDEYAPPYSSSSLSSTSSSSDDGLSLPNF